MLTELSQTNRSLLPQLPAAAACGAAAAATRCTPPNLHHGCRSIWRDAGAVYLHAVQMRDAILDDVWPCVVHDANNHGPKLTTQSRR